MTIKNQIPVIEKRWYAVKCKFRCEKRLMKEFNDLGVDCYVPIQRKIKQYYSRRRISEITLIPSHIFVCINQSQYSSVLEHRHTFGFLNFSGALLSIPQCEIEIMRRVVGEIDNVSITDIQCSVGDKVQIIGGELTGLEGILIKEGNQNVKIELTSLGMGLVININPEHLLKEGLAKAVA